MYLDLFRLLRGKFQSPRLASRKTLPAAEDRPAIDVEDLTGDVPGQVGGQEQDGAGDIFGGRDALQGDGLTDLLPVTRLAEDARAHVRVHPAGGYGVDPDPIRSEPDGKG